MTARPPVQGLAMPKARRRVPVSILLAAFLLTTATAPSCATIQTGARKIIPGAVVEKPGLAEAEVLIWREAYGRTDASPLVYLVEGDGLTCASEHSGKPGFDCPSVGCREGCTAIPYAVSVAFDGTAPWSGTTLAHENMHALKMRRAIEAMRFTPTQATLDLVADGDHKGPEWQPGGDVDKANALLVRHGL